MVPSLISIKLNRDTGSRSVQYPRINVLILRLKDIASHCGGLIKKKTPLNFDNCAV